MAPKKDKAPPTSFLGSTKMTRMMLKDLEDRGVIAAGLRRVPPKAEVYAKPEGDEVIVFRYFFPAGLRFPLDAAVVEIFRRYGVYLH